MDWKGHTERYTGRSNSDGSGRWRTRYGVSRRDFDGPMHMYDGPFGRPMHMMYDDDLYDDFPPPFEDDFPPFCARLAPHPQRARGSTSPHTRAYHVAKRPSAHTLVPTPC